MTRRAWIHFPPGRRARRLAALAGASWLPGIGAALRSDDRNAIAVCLLLAFALVTLLPLATPSIIDFHHRCLVIGWAMLVLQIAVSLPFALIPLPVFVLYLPAGVLLLLAARCTGGIPETVVAAMLTAVPYLVDLAGLVGWPASGWA
ncbi:hypothetical protein ACPC54_34495 [Kitasatospora sp. NPDC094028]